MSVVPLSGGSLTATDLANSLVGPGVSVSNAVYTGSLDAAGVFTGGTGIIGFEQGVILSTGIVSNVVGPNVDDGISWGNGTPGDADLDTLVTFPTNDAAVLEFDITPIESGLIFNFVFASDEYNEFVNDIFNDVFAFYINGNNCALVSGSPVSVNTINNGNPFGTNPTNPQLYINNDLDDGGGMINTEMDGLTKVLSCLSFVNPGVPNHVKLAIADTSDSIWDSNVFLETGSFISELPPRSYLPIVIK
ncbi:MAG: choice-of-anchor L domain-containing protein [Anaerolineales bacterium]|nr:choice-of-anchor L domain-containing protein [Anaerolineales bacterium]